MLEKYLIDCCSPTLASLKSGSLFSCSCNAVGGCPEEHIREWNERLNDKGIRLHMLRKTDKSVLIYVFRVSALTRRLESPDVAEFLETFGYECCSECGSCDEHAQCLPDKCIVHLCGRINSLNEHEDMKFPHEIGIFLDYPLHDVKEFIKNKGRNSKHTGAWKVYGDEHKARAEFDKFCKCSDIYSRLWSSGEKTIMQLTVAG